MDSIPQDYRDIAIETLAASEAELREDVARYRELAMAAIHELHALTQTLNRLREQHHRLIAEYRALREQILLGRAA